MQDSAHGGSYVDDLRLRKTETNSDGRSRNDGFDVGRDQALVEHGSGGYTRCRNSTSPGSDGDCNESDEEGLHDTGNVES